jgi:hypothetical protein
MDELVDKLVDKLNAECKYRDKKGFMFARKWTHEDINIEDDSLDWAYCTLIDKVIMIILCVMRVKPR